MNVPAAGNEQANWSAEVSAKVAALLEGRRVRVDLLATTGGQKVLGMSRAVVQLG